MRKPLLLSLVIFTILLALTGCINVSADASQTPSFWSQIDNWFLFNLFVFGGLGFWIYCSIWMITIMLWCSEDDWGLPAIIVVVGALGLWLFGAFNPFVLLYNFATTSPLHLIGIFLAYVIIGLIYASIKIKLLGNSLAKNYERILNDFFKTHGITDGKIPANLLKKWEQRCDDLHITNKPDVDRYSERLLFWLTWWPLSMPRTIFREIIIRFFKNLYEFCKGYFQRILLSSFSKFDQAMPVIPEISKKDNSDEDDEK